MVLAAERRIGQRWARVEAGVAARMLLLQPGPDDQNLDEAGDSGDRR